MSSLEFSRLDPWPFEPWRRIGSRTAYTGFVTVNRDTYKEPDGTVSDWDIIAGPDSAAALAFTPAGTHVVLFEQFRVGPAKTLCELPGGYVNDDEQPELAAKRELKEETGYEAASVYYAGSEWCAANSSRRKHIIIAAEARPASDPSWDSSEMGRVQLLPTKELIDFLRNGELTDAGLACRALISLASSTPQDPALAKLRETICGLLWAFR